MQFRNDFRSKLVDGLLMGMILYLVSRLLVLLDIPFRNLLDNRSGELLFTIGVLALSVFCLERAIISRTTDTNHAWYGAVGGVFGWTVISLSNRIGAVNLVSIAGIVSFIMVALIVSVFWRSKYFPIGAQFFSATLFLNWFGSLLLLTQKYLIERFFLSTTWSMISGLIFFLIDIGLVYFLFAKSERRLQRVWIGVFLYFFTLMTIASLYGWVI